MKLRSLAEFLGRGRLQRLREATLNEMLQTLNEAGIAYTFPRGRGAADFVTMSLHVEQTRVTAPPTFAARPSGDPVQPRMLALSIRQPYVELILRGQKAEEYRSRPAKVRGRVYLYASNSPADDPDSWDRVGCAPGHLPTGKLVGTVEVVGCNSYGEREDAAGLCETQSGSRDQLLHATILNRLGSTRGRREQYVEPDFQIERSGHECWRSQIADAPPHEPVPWHDAGWDGTVCRNPKEQPQPSNPEADWQDQAQRK